jgi:hypothetical protein
VRWEALFGDLEAQVDALATAERAAEVDERARIETGSLPWRQRLQAALGAAVQVRVAGGLMLAGRLRRVGPDWILLEEEGSGESLVSLSAVSTVAGLPRYAVPDATSLFDSRLSLRSALRGLARDRAPVRVHLVDPAAGIVHGTVDRVGADFVDLAQHAPGEHRRREQVRGGVVIPLAALAAVRRAR